jgi:hypothetical protein
LAKNNTLAAGISTLLGEGPVAVSETKHPVTNGGHDGGLEHPPEALFDGLANSPAAAATATTMAIAANRLFISSPPSGG